MVVPKVDDDFLILRLVAYITRQDEATAIRPVARPSLIRLCTFGSRQQTAGRDRRRGRQDQVLAVLERLGE